jgi:hypothetical protein
MMSEGEYVNLEGEDLADLDFIFENEDKGIYLML